MKCCILQCGARKNKLHPKLTLHRFPSNKSLRNKWLEIIGPENINPGLQNLFVCSLHFVEASFNRTLNVVRLHDGAVPSILDVLKKMRILDDKIVYALNTSLPTESFQKNVDASAACNDLYKQIHEGHEEREKIIKGCIVKTAELVQELRQKREEKPDNVEIMRNFKAEQKKLRLLQTELSVEEVIKEKTTKLFNEKCRSYFKPTNL